MSRWCSSRLGSFTMGSSSGAADEQPEHSVSVDAFLMDRTEVTQQQYDKLALGNPSHFKGKSLPVEQISWADAALYCNLRSRSEGLQPCYDEETAECDFQASGYRLPTEAEWEYACRAGGQADQALAGSSRELLKLRLVRRELSEENAPRCRKSARIGGGFSTCRATWPSGATTCMTRLITRRVRQTIRRDPPGENATSCVAAHGIQRLHSAVRRLGSEPILVSRTPVLPATPSVSAAYVACRHTA